MALVEEHAQPKPGVEDISMEMLMVSRPGIQFRLLLSRDFTVYWRTPAYNVTRLIITILIGLVFGSLFWRKGDDRTTVTGVLNIMGVLYSSTLFLGITNCLTVQHTVALQRTVFYRERAAGLYGVLPFAVAQQLVELPYLMIQSAIYSAIVYWMVWFARDAGGFFYFFFFFFLTLAYFTFFGVMGISLTPNVAMGNVLCTFFFGFFNLLSGFLMPKPEIRGWWIWFYYINPVNWSIYALVESQLYSFHDTYITTLEGVVLTVPQFLKETFAYSAYMIGPLVAILFGASPSCSGMRAGLMYRVCVKV